MPSRRAEWLRARWSPLVEGLKKTYRCVLDSAFDIGHRIKHMFRTAEAAATHTDDDFKAKINLESLEARLPCTESLSALMFTSGMMNLAWIMGEQTLSGHSGASMVPKGAPSQRRLDADEEQRLANQAIGSPVFISPETPEGLPVCHFYLWPRAKHNLRISTSPTSTAL